MPVAYELSYVAWLLELIPEYCMKINEKFDPYLIITGCNSSESNEY